MCARNFVAESFAFAGSLHQTGDVDELERRRHDALGLHDPGQLLQPLVRHLDHADVGINGAKRVVGRLGPRPRNGVEQRGFPDVGQSHDSA